MEDINAQTVSNSLVKCTIKRKPSSQVEFAVVASPEICLSSHAKAAKSVAKEVSIPGFRKGKAPESFILKKFPKELKQKWQEVLTYQALEECYKLTDVRPLDKETRITFNMETLSTEGSHFTFLFDTAPVIPEITPGQYTLPEVKRTVITDETVQETIRQALFFYATWEKEETRPIQEGDFVLLNVDLIEKEPVVSLFANTRFEVTDKSMAQWMKNLLIGKQVDDVVEGVSVPDQDAESMEDQLLQPQKVRISIKALEKPTLPELTPEFLKSLGADSLEDLTKKVETLLNKQADDQAREKQREHAREFILRNYPFDLPATLVDKEIRFRVQQLNQNMDFLKHWQTLNEENKQKIIQTIREQSEKAVKMFHLSNKFLKDHNISLSEAELPKAPETPLEALVYPDQMNHYHEQPGLQRAEATSRLMLEQLEDYVINHASKPEQTLAT